MADVVLDANVLVGWLDANDALAARSEALRVALGASGDSPVVVYFLLAEALSVISRRSRERNVNPPDLAAIVESSSARVGRGEIVFLSDRVPALFERVLDRAGGMGVRARLAAVHRFAQRCYVAPRTSPR